MKDCVVILLHGLGGSPEEHFSHLKKTVALDAALYSNIDFDPFSYDSRKITLTHFTFLRRYPSLADIAASFANHLSQKAAEYEHIFLVGYSCGGIVIKEGLLACKDSYAIKRIQRIAFIATPHQGSDLANFADFFGIGSKITQELKAGSPHLQDLDTQWEQSGLNTIPSLYIYGIRDNIVRYDNALRDKVKVFVTPSADHSSILKFTSDSKQYQRLREWLLSHDDPGSVTAFGDSLSTTFSPSIVDEVSELKTVIGKLTDEQFSLFDRIRADRRRAIKGCAGSGKTLIAAEKSIRLANAGYSVGLFCHSPILLNRIKALVKDADRIQVFYFYDYIIQLISGNTVEHVQGWEEFEEPSDEEIYQALASFDKHSSLKFDAIIVDEGQDFKEDWLDLLQSALLEPSNGLFYVFFDEMQSSRQRTDFPSLLRSPEVLHTNCRNAGNVFEYVHRFYPMPSACRSALRGKGQFKLFDLDTRFDRSGTNALREAIADAIEIVGDKGLVVLTNEPDIRRSLLNGLQVHRHRRYQWQLGLSDFMKQTITAATRYYVDRVKSDGADDVRAISLPHLSSDSYPTDSDRKQVESFVKRMRRICDYDTVLGESSIEWRSLGGKLSPVLDLPKDSWLKSIWNSPRANSSELFLAQALSFLSGNWWASLAEPPVYDVRPYYECRSTDIPLYKISHFKGCEADGIVLFIQSSDDGLNKTVYTGLSRARYCLNLVCRPEPLSRIPQITEDSRF
jgi:hypothetical protein